MTDIPSTSLQQQSTWSRIKARVELLASIIGYSPEEDLARRVLALEAEVRRLSGPLDRTHPAVAIRDGNK